MKKQLILLVSLFLMFGTAGLSSAALIDYVDIGDPTSEAVHNLVDWGPVWDMDASGFSGNWGGGAPNGDRTWRTISHQPNDAYDWAAIYLNFGSGCSLSFIHLEGIALDSFSIHIGSVANDPIWTYPGRAETDELWFETMVPIAPLVGTQTIVFNSTGMHWGGYDTFGQVAFASISVENAPVPEPATMILLGSGLVGLAGIGRRKFFKKA